jgi:hypothetical protein
VAVLSVSAGHEHADRTVYVDRGAVMTVTVTQNALMTVPLTQHAQMTVPVTQHAQMTVPVTQHCYCISNCSSWFISYWKLDNLCKENWQYETNSCGLFVFLCRDMLEEMRKNHNYWLGIGTTNILKRSFELIVASVTCTRTCVVLLRATFWRPLTTVEQTNKQTDTLPSRVVHFTDCDIITIYAPFIQFIYIKTQCRAVFTVSTVDTESTGNVTPRELRLREDYRLCENE